MTYLRSQVESEVTASSQSILYQQGNFVGEAELDRLGKPSRLAEVDEVFQGEGQGDGFSKFDFDVHLWLLDVVMASQRNSTVSNVTSAGELNPILGCFNGDCIVKQLAY
jgi:hypothetical protein